MAETTKAATPKSATYTKEDLLNSPSLAGYQRDILNAALEDGQDYTAKQVEDTIKKFKGGLL
ncbi:hypothetical protein [Lacticaseibacillus saniviri]|uniref:YqzN/YkzM domain-containing protein n=1 Tax=Lacticaseibacillus saniviri JCM 17471 = DSM 24301 TaxID=1293598 RepID=A0A0R2MSS0_9LACO|nr:hypothetical protein [Lacticaseibacillus saniviri]KRO16631.1 hypothetical protein IV56_GL001076 [Lacticaseibacillus saniviri JCM 17471 = DSM 24301]